MQENTLMPALFDVSDYGAIPDGKTINTSAFQRAIDACHEAGGGRVYCRSGTWVTGVCSRPRAKGCE